MKQMRIWALLICLCVLCMALPLAAHADAAVQESGGWRYRLLEDGSAEVLGYTGEEAELTVPLCLNGAWVTAIGENAFAEHSSLNRLTVPSSVTTIADSAFSGSPSVTLRAYNGTEALHYAAEAGLASENRSQFDFFADVIDLSDMQTAQWSLTDTTLTVSEPFDALIVPGAKLYLPPTGEFPAGYAVKVTSAEAAEGTVTAQVAELAFTEAVATYHVEDASIPFNPANFVPAPGVTMLAAESRADVSAGNSIPLRFYVNEKYGETEVTGSIGLNMSFMTSAHYEKFNITQYSQTVSFTQDVNVKVSGSLSKDILLGDYFFTSPQGLVVSFRVWFTPSVSGEIELKGEKTVSFTQVYDNVTGGHTYKKDDTGAVASVTVTGNAEVGIRFSPGFGIGFGRISMDIAWMNATAKLYAKSEYTSLAPYCADIRAGMDATVDYYIGMRTAGTDGSEAATPFFGGTIWQTSAELAHWHYEGLERVLQDECTYEGVCTVRFVTGGSAMESKMYSAGQPIGYVEMPSRLDYTFDRWYTDPGLTQQFDMDSNLPSGTLTLYAGWKESQTTYAPPPSRTPPPAEDGDPVTTPVVTARPTPTIGSWNNSGTSVPSGGNATGTVMTPTADGLTFSTYLDGHSTGSGVYITSLSSTQWVTSGHGCGMYETSGALLDFVVPETLEFDVVSYGYMDCQKPNCNGRVRYVEKVLYPAGTPIRGVCAEYNIRSLTVPENMDVVIAGGSALVELDIGNYAGEVKIDYATNLTSLSLHGVETLYITELPRLKDLTITNDNGDNTSVGSPSYYNLASLETLTLENVYLDNFFNGLPNLKTLNSTGYSRMKYAFNECPNLTDINFEETHNIEYSFMNGPTEPINVTLYGYVDEYSFHGTPLHVTIETDDNGPIWNFANWKNLLSVTFTGGKGVNLREGCFFNCTNLKSVKMPGWYYTYTQSMQYDDYGYGYSGDELALFTKCSDVDLVVGYESDEVRSYYISGLLGKCDEEETVINSLTIAPTVKKIDYAAFADFGGFKGELALPASLERIGGSAFEYCDGITSLRLPDSVTYIGSLAFFGCDSLESIPALDNVQSMGIGAFGGNKNITSVHLPAIANEWEYGPFEYCENLESVTLDPGLTVIPARTFSGCKKLRDIEFHEGLVEIGNAAFSNTPLSEITLPSTLEIVGLQAFCNCDSAESIKFSGSALKKVGSMAFYECRNVSTLELPDHEFEWGDEAFWFNDALEELTIPGALKTIPFLAFGDYTKLEKLIVSEGVEHISEYAFQSAESLKTLVLPSTLKSIGTSAFVHSGLTSVTLQEGLETIDDYAFYGSGITEIELPSTLTYIGDNALPETISSITVRNDRMEFDEDFATWPDMWYDSGEIIIFANQNSTIAEFVYETGDYYNIRLVPLDSELYTATFLLNYDGYGSRVHKTEACFSDMLLSRPEAPSRDGYVFTDWYTEPECETLWNFNEDKMPEENLVLYAGWKKDTNAAWTPVDDGLIYDGSKDSGSSVELPGFVNGLPVVAIGPDGVSRYCRQLHISAGIREIDPTAFSNAERLESITVDADNRYFYAVDGVLFTADGTLVHYPRMMEAKEYTVPEGTTAIGSNAFSTLNKLEHLTLASTVRTLHANAIGEPGKLTKVTFTADPESIDPTAIFHVRGLSVNGPQTAPVLDAYLQSFGMQRNLQPLYLVIDGYVALSVAVQEGTLIPTDLIPDNADLCEPARLMIGWSPDGSAENLWDFSRDTMPGEMLQLHAVFADAYAWEDIGGYARLLRYNGTSREVEVPAYYKGLKVTMIAEDCFGSTDGLTLTGEGYSVVSNWVSSNGGTYKPLTCTLLFDTGCDIIVEPIQVEIGTYVSLPSPQRYGYYLSGWVYEGDYYYSGLNAQKKEMRFTADWDTSYGADSVEKLLTYTTTDAGAVITGLTGSAKEINVPETLGGAAVVGIADYAFSGSNAASITLPDSITSIGSYAFQHCAYLNTIKLPAGLTTIGEGAFYGCSELTNLELPDGVKTIPDGMLAYCRNLTEISLPAALTSIVPDAFYGCSKLAVISLSEDNAAYKLDGGVLYSKDGKHLALYAAGISGDSFTVPASVTHIDACAMGGARFSTLTVPASVTSIGEEAVKECRALTNLVLPGTGSMTIGDNAFAGCSNLKNVCIAEGVKSIGAGAFAGCPLVSVTVNGAGVTLAEDAFPVVEDMYIRAAKDSAGAAWAAQHGVFCIGLNDVLATDAEMETVYVKLGETITLQPVYTPANAVQGGARYKISGNSGAVSIDGNGVVSTWRTGKVNVSIYLAGGSYCGSFDILVYENVLDAQRIELSSTEMTLSAGDARKLTAVLAPFGDDEITWSSSDEDIAYYDAENNAVVAVANGQAVITASTASGVRASCLVTVGGAINYGPIHMDRSYIEMELYEEDSLYCWIEDVEHEYDNVTWSCSNPNVIEIFESYRTSVYFGSVGLGEAIITATADCGYVASCTVVVMEDAQRLILSREYVDVGVGWLTSLWLRDVPSTSKEIIWNSDDPDIAYYDESRECVVGVSEGHTWLSVSTDDGYYDECFVEVVFWGTMYLPASLRAIGEEAFAGSDMFYVECPDGLTSIGSRAFAECMTLEQIYIPASVTYIAPDAFEDSWSMWWIIGHDGSYAQTYARENGYNFEVID